MARNLTAGSVLGVAVLHLHTQLLACENADGSWPGAYAVTLLEEFFQRVGLQSCVSWPTGHDRSEGAPA